MKDEEMAEERATKFTDINYNEPDNYGSAKEIGYFSYHAGFLAGLKAGRPQWHDLRKDPDDLPKDEKDMLMSEQLILLTKMKGTDNLNISIGQYNFSTQEFSYPHFIGLTDVIAWCEIPTFDKE